MIQPAAPGRWAASIATASPSRSATHVQGACPATSFAVSRRSASSVSARSLTAPKRESNRMISMPRRATASMSPGPARRIRRPVPARSRDALLTADSPPATGAVRAARTSSGSSPCRSSVAIPSTSRQGQLTTAAVSASPVPGSSARWSRHSASNRPSPSGTPGSATAAESWNLRAAPQDRSRDPGAPAQCSHHPAAMIPPSPATTSGAPQCGGAGSGDGSSGSISRQRRATPAPRLLAASGAADVIATSRRLQAVPLMLARLLRAAMVIGSAAGRLSSQRSTVSRSSFVASVLRPTP